MGFGIWWIIALKPRMSSKVILIKMALETPATQQSYVMRMVNAHKVWRAMRISYVSLEIALVYKCCVKLTLLVATDWDVMKRVIFVSAKQAFWKWVSGSFFIREDHVTSNRRPQWTEYRRTSSLCQNGQRFSPRIEKSTFWWLGWLTMTQRNSQLFSKRSIQKKNTCFIGRS